MIFQNHFCGWLAEYNHNDSIELIYVGGLRNIFGLTDCKVQWRSSYCGIAQWRSAGGSR